MKRQILRTFLLVGSVLLIVDWILGVARFHSEAARYAFVVLNLPSSLMFEWLDSQPVGWWRSVVRLEPEVGSAMAFLAMVGVQAGLLSLGLTSRRMRSGRQAA